jgi:heme exporter protein D
MLWHSAAEFFAMGGYAGYVWGSVGACALAMTLEPWLVHRRRARVLRELRRLRAAAPAHADVPARITARRRQTA